MTTLPVDGIIPQILSALESSPSVIIQAPPGSGKSTRIPLSLLDSKWLVQNKILMLEPRRLAALNLASWISSGIGDEVGGVVGYAIRFDRKSSSRTRLEIVTEGILTRRLQSDPFLESVGAVIFDEFHERSIHTDTSLALCLYLQRTVRPDLRILVMSATLETQAISNIMPEAKVITCEGKLHPVEIRYLGTLDEDPAKSAAKAVVVALNEFTGDILVFLPGAAEIRRCLKILEQHFPSGEPVILPLYGDLSFADQERAIRASDRRRVVLATNIAETSITIEGVTIVVDSGLARKSRYDSSRALNRLVTERISKASAAQRAGRSGRTAPGVCYRLWNEYQQTALLSYDLPEILTSDLSELALNLALWGVHDVSDLSFPDPPPVSSLSGSRRMLRLLAALDDDDRITDRGRRLAKLPLHPRLAALLLAAVEDGSGCLGADIAAIISERDFLKSDPRHAAPLPDLIDRVDTLVQWRTSPDIVRLRGDADIAAIRSVDRLSRELRRILSINTVQYEPSYVTVALLVATAFPDRIARQREAGSSSYLLASGKGAVLAHPAGADQKFIVAVRLEAGRGGDARIFSALSIEQSQLKMKFSHLIFARRFAVWDPSLRRVTAREEEMFGAITLESKVVKAEKGDVVTAVLECLRKGGDNNLFLNSPVAEKYKARVDFLHNLYPEDGWPDLSYDRLLKQAEEWLEEIIDSLEAPEKFNGIDTLALFRNLVGWKMERDLDRLAPLTISVPSGSSIKIDYCSEGGPLIAVKLQEMFGLAVTPRIAGAKVPLVIHLLSPAGRPIQVTADLCSFWENGYQIVKKELKGRYPKHPWPDDPWSALPTKSLKKRSG